MTSTKDDIRSICAWCGIHLSGRADAPMISHGLCPSCLQAELAKLAAEKAARS